MENPWLGLNGDAPSDSECWGDGGIATCIDKAIDTINAGECGFGESGPVPSDEYLQVLTTLGERTDELFKVCRALTEIVDFARSEAPEFYQKHCAQFIEGDNDVRPDDFLEKTYRWRP